MRSEEPLKESDSLVYAAACDRKLCEFALRKEVSFLRAPNRAIAYHFNEFTGWQPLAPVEAKKFEGIEAALKVRVA